MVWTQEARGCETLVQWLACLPLDPRFACSNPAEGDGFSRSIKIRNTTSFGGEIMPTVPCCKILRHVKDPYNMKEIHVGKIN
jgi:hypothetical protein